MNTDKNYISARGNRMYEEIGSASVATNTREQSNETRTVFEHRMERLGRQTTHYIKSDSTTFYFVRRPGQTDNEMRKLGQWIASTLNKANTNTATN